MRYALSIASLILGAVLLVLGVCARTVFAGPAVISVPLPDLKDSRFAVISVGQLSAVPGVPRVDVTADEAFVGQGKLSDVYAWVSASAHVALKLNGETREWQVKRVSADAAAVSAEKKALQKNEEAAAGGVLVAPSDTRLKGGKLVLDPVGSDLWQVSDTISKGSVGEPEKTINVPVVQDDTNAILLASNGVDPLPESVTVSWDQVRKTPWAGPLLSAGALFAVVGIVLYLLALDKHHAGRGPRRGRRGPFIGLRNIFGGKRRHRKRFADAGGTADADAVDAAAAGAADSAAGKAARVEVSGGVKEMRVVVRRRRSLFAAALLGVGALGLSGCSATYWPDFSSQEKNVDAEKEQSEKALAPVPVTDQQISSIVEQIASVTQEADKKLDASLLPQRFTADALAQRVANYKVRAAVQDYGIVPPVITNESLDYKLVQSTENWPRTMLLTVASQSAETASAEDAETDSSKGSEEESTDSSPSLALLLTQQNPHENFLVNRVIALRGGITMPIAAPAEEGTALLADDASTLKLTPAQVGKQFSKLLQEGASSGAAEYFDLGDSTILEHYGAAYVEQAKAKAAESGSECSTLGFSVNVAPASTAPIALSTGAGGAIVATTVLEERIVDGGGGRCLPQASATVKALSGLEGEQKRLVHDVAHQVLFYVPAVNAEGAQQKVQLLGVTSELIGVRN